MRGLIGWSKDLGLTLTAVALTAVAALAGVGWLSLAFFRAVEPSLGPVWAPILVGGICLLPVLFVMLWLALSQNRKSEPTSEAAFSSLALLLPRFVDIVDTTARRHPYGTIAVCALAGFVAAINPRVVSRIVNEFVHTENNKASADSRARTDEMRDVA